MTKMKNNKKGAGEGFFSKALLLILSLIIAIALWYLGTAQNQIQISKIYSDIPVRVTNVTDIENQTFSVKFIMDSTVSAVLKGYSSELKTADETGVVALIDLNSINSAGEYDITPTITGCPANVVISNVSSVKVKVEAMVTKQIGIEIETKGSAAEGYYVDSANIDFVKTISIKASESVLNTIYGAKIIVDITDKNASFTENVDVVIMGTNGENIDSSKYILQHNSVSVSVPVLKYAE